MSQSRISEILESPDAQLYPGGRPDYRRTTIIGRAVAENYGADPDKLDATPLPSKQRQAQIRNYLRGQSDPPVLEGNVETVEYGEGSISLREDGTCLVYSGDSKPLWYCTADGRAGNTDIGDMRQFDLDVFLDEGMTWVPSSDTPEPAKTFRSGPR